MELKSSHRSFGFQAELLVCLVAVAASVASAWPLAAELLEYNRTLIGQGQVWRVITGHVVHWTPSHWFWDVATFLVLGIVCARNSPARFAAALGASAAAISAFLWCCRPQIEVYRGLSGVDTTLFTMLAVGLWRDARRDGSIGRQFAAAALVGALPAKTAFEWITGSTLFVDPNPEAFIPLVGVHIVGAIVGCACAIVSNGLIPTPAIVRRRKASGR